MSHSPLEGLHCWLFRGFLYFISSFFSFHFSVITLLYTWNAYSKSYFPLLTEAWASSLVWYIRICSRLLQFCSVLTHADHFDRHVYILQVFRSHNPRIERQDMFQATLALICLPRCARECFPDMNGFAITIPYQEAYMTCRDSISSCILSHLISFRYQ